MTANQFRAALEKTGLSQLEAARILNANERTVRRWAIGERTVPKPVAIMLRLMIAGKITTKDIEAVNG